jgi:site-specific DNA-methyltransferase (adenine-specific)
MRIETLAEGVTLYNADCREVLPTLGKVDACITDPPYGILAYGLRDFRGGRHGLGITQYRSYSDTYENFVKEIVPRLNAALDIADRGGVFTGPHIVEQRKPNALGGVYCAAATGRNEWGFKNFLPVLLYGKAPDLNLGAKTPTAITSTSTVGDDFNHPCPKPLRWMEWLVTLVSRKRETILDPFMGSGTTGVAAVKLGRKFIGIEIEEKYYNIAVRRISDALKQPDLFIESPREKPSQLSMLREWI